jgi:amino acid adenylation domain-containing protein
MSDLKTRLAALSPEQRTLLEQRLLSKEGTVPLRDSVPRRDETGPAPLSYSQAQLWFLDQLSPGTASYNVPNAFALSGPLDLAVLEQSLEALFERHEVLRTVYECQDGTPVQVVKEKPSRVLHIVDLRCLPAAERDRARERTLQAEAARPFDLARDLMLRATLVRVTEDEAVLLLVAHHIAWDLVSKGVLLRELSVVYAARVTGQPASLPALPIQYADYAVWQRRYLQGEVLQGLAEYWKGQLAGLPEKLELPTDRARPPIQSLRGAKFFFRMPAQLAEAARALSRQEGTTLFIALLAAFKTFLYGWSGQEDIVVGSPNAGRTRVETEGLLGFFINTQILRTRFAGMSAFRDVLARVKETALGAFAHQELPFEKAVEIVRPPRDLSRNPLFQVNFRVAGLQAVVPSLPGVTARPLELIDTVTSKFDLALELAPGGETLSYWEYSTDLFEEATIVRLCGEFERLLGSLLQSPDVPLAQLEAFRALQARREAALARPAGARKPVVASTVAPAPDLRQRIDALSPAKQRLLDLLRRKQETGTPAGPTIPRRPDRESGPLSFSQERLWLLDQLLPQRFAYNVPRGVRIRAAVDPVALQRALDGLVARHEALRTTYTQQGDRLVQRAHPPAGVALAFHDLSRLPGQDRQARSEQLMVEEVRRPFDLSRDLMLRGLLIRLAPEEHLLLIVTHHIASDGWSRSILFRELAALYEALHAGRPSPLPELPLQYLEFAAWQRDWFRGEVLDRQLAYWKTRLAGPVPRLDLPADRPRPAVETLAGARHTALLPPSLVDRLHRLGQQEGATLFMTVLAAFKTLLQRWTGSDDVIVGTPVSGRNRPEVEPLIGVFTNTLVLRSDLSGDPTFRECLRRVRTTALEAYEHADLPYEKLIAELQPARERGEAPLFRVLFALEEGDTLPAGTSALPLEPLEIDSGAVKQDLGLVAAETSEGLRVRIEYATDLFDPATIHRLADHFRTLLEGMGAEPDARLSRLTLLTLAEREQILVRWNDTAIEEPIASRIEELLEAQVARTPQHTAVVFGSHSLTYVELDRRASQLAAWLRKQGVRSGTLVGIHVERSLEMMIGLLGVLKAGGAYVPLDPAFPRDRLAFMMEDAQVGFLLTQERLQGSLPENQAQVTCLDADWPAISREDPQTERPSSRPEDLAYVLYTSGSTGRPKGVEITHGSVVNFLASMNDRPGIDPGDTLLAVTTLSFDISGLELFWPLASGARVVIAPREVAADGAALAALLRECGATIMQATPATWRLLLAAGWQGAPGLKVLCGGEELPRSLADQLLPKCAALWNMYGPTETTIWSAVQRVEPGTGPVPIGRPIQNTRVYVLDRHDQLLPVGVPGELYIGGAGVARGYLGRPALTAERFLPDRFYHQGAQQAAAGARMYRTGDLAKYRADGTLECLGRADSQVKIRGFRIELGEIEALLRSYPAVAEAVAEVRDRPDGEKQLVAFLVPKPGESLPDEGVRRFLRGQLPEYMVPAILVQLDRLPLTPNGKIDRRALPADLTGLAPSRVFVPPLGPIESQVARVWAEELRVERVGAEDNYFELGGHSLLAARLMGRLREEFRIDLPLRALFEGPTVRQLARAIEDRLLAETDNEELENLLGAPADENTPPPA